MPSLSAYASLAPPSPPPTPPPAPPSSSSSAPPTVASTNFPDPALLASPSFLGSFAGSLPALSLDPFLAPFLADPAAWPLSPSPVLRAADTAALFTARSADKYNKHLAGCIAQERTFLPVVFSTLGGLGPPESAHYLDSLFSEVYAAELAATGTTRRTSHLRTLFLQSLLASLTAATADMASSLTRDASLDADDDDDVDPAAGAVPTPPGVPAPPVPPAPR